MCSLIQGQYMLQLPACVGKKACIIQTVWSDHGPSQCVLAVLEMAGWACCKLSSFSQGEAFKRQPICPCIACACRKAVVRAGVRQPSMVHVGLTSMMDYMGETDKAAFNSTLHKGMSMSQQVDRFQVRLALCR